MTTGTADEVQTTAGSLMKVSDAADWLGVSERTLWSITTPRGSLPSVRIGARVLYRPADLASYAEAQSRLA